MTQINYRTLNTDLYDPDSSLNFPLSTLLPSSLPAPSTASEAASIGQQIRQLLRSGDAEGALQGVLETAPLGGDEGAKQVHLGTVVEVLQGIRQSDVARLLGGLVEGEGGAGRADCLMKYLYVLFFFALLVGIFIGGLSLRANYVGGFAGIRACRRSLQLLLHRRRKRRYCRKRRGSVRYKRGIWGREEADKR